VGGGCLPQVAGFSFAAAATPAGPDGSQRPVLQLLQRFALCCEMPPPRPVLSVSPARSPRGGLHAPEGSLRRLPGYVPVPPRPRGGGGGWFAVATATSAPASTALGCPAAAPASASLGPAAAGFPLSTAAAVSGLSPTTAATASGFSPADAPDVSSLSHASPAAGPSCSSSSSGLCPSRCYWVAPSPGQGASGGRCSAGPAS
jgi:hypothetical protein